MTREEKLKMLLHPEQYTDEQMDEMLNDTDINIPDADEAWECFRGEKLEGRGETAFKKFSLMKIAAMFIGVLMLSGITYAAIHMVQSIGAGDNTPSMTEAQMSDSRQQSGDNDKLAADSIPAMPVVFEDAELSAILSEVAAFYQVQPVFKSEASKHVRLYFTWDKKQTIDELIDTFNKFERIHITRENQKLIVE